MIWKELQTVAPSTRHHDVPTGYRYLAPCLYTVQTQNLQAQACTVALELPTPIAAERDPALGHLIYLHEYLCCLEARHRLATGIKQRQPREAVHGQRHRQQCQRHRDTGVRGQLLDGGVLQPLHQERRRGSACRMRNTNFFRNLRLPTACRPETAWHAVPQTCICTVIPATVQRALSGADSARIEQVCIASCTVSIHACCRTDATERRNPRRVPT